MYRSLMVVVVAVGSLFVAPTLAVGGIGAHQTLYAEFVMQSALHQPIEIAYQRYTHVAEILGGLRCLGTIQHGPDKGAPATFDDWPLSAPNNQIHFTGKTHNYPGSPDASAPRKIHISLILKHHVATGTITFPGTKCGVIKIAAPVEKINP